METVRDLDLVRDTLTRVDMRADDASDGATMVVRFSVFDTWYEIDSFWEGTFLERTARGAFSKTMQESRGTVKTLFNHGYGAMGDMILGDVTDLREDQDAAVLEARLFDGIDPLLMSGLRAGAYGSSFMFRVIMDEWNDEPGTSDANPKGIPERTIKEVRLYEAGPVTWPANPAATAGIRSATDAYYEALQRREPQRVDSLRARTLAIRTPNEEAVRKDTLTPGAAPDSPSTPDSREHHVVGLTPSQRRAALFDFLTTPEGMAS